MDNNDTATAQKTSFFINKNFALLFCGDFVSSLGSTFYSFAVSFYILEISGNNALLQGAFLATGSLVWLAFASIGGVLADRWNKAKILYVTDFIRGGAILASGAVVLFFADSPAAQIVSLFAATVVLNLNGALFSPAVGSILRFLVRDEQLQRAQSNFSAQQSLVGILGMVLAGILYSTLGFFWIIIIDGASYVFSAVSEMFIKYEYVPNAQPLTLKSTFVEIGQGFRYLWGVKPIFSAMVLALGLNFFLNPIFSNGTVYFCSSALTGSYLFSSFLTKESWLAVIEAVFSASMLVTSVVIGSRPQAEHVGGIMKRSMAIMAAVACAVAAVYMVFVGNFGPTPFLIALLSASLLLGMVMPSVNIHMSVALQKTVAKDMLGKVSATTSLLSMALLPIASVAAGAVIQYAGLGWMMVFSAAGLVLMAVLGAINRPLNEI